MNRKRLFQGVGLGFLLVMIVSVAGWVVVNAQDCRVIRINGMVVHDSVRLEPETTWVSKDTCVIWFNRASATNIKVIFEEGKKCADATDAPTGFRMDYGSCYVTSWVPFGGSSSLRFKEKGIYTYIIETASGGPESLPERGTKLAEGRVIVSE